MRSVASRCSARRTRSATRRPRGANSRIPASSSAAATARASARPPRCALHALEAAGSCVRAGFGVEFERAAIERGDRLRGGLRARQVAAGDDHVGAILRQPVRAVRRACSWPRRVGRDVQLALQAGLDVPGGLAVSYPRSVASSLPHGSFRCTFLEFADCAPSAPERCASGRDERVCWSRFTVSRAPDDRLLLGQGLPLHRFPPSSPHRAGAG